MYMISKFFKSLALLLTSLAALSSEFRFQNEYDPETGEGHVRLFLINDTGDFIGFSCTPSNTWDGPYVWFSLKEKINNNSNLKMFYKVDSQTKESFEAWKVDDYLLLTRDGEYSNIQFQWIEDFLQSLQGFETLTLGRSKSIREAKFKSPQKKENLIKFLEQAKNIDSCYVRSIEQEFKENKAKAEAEAERKRREAEAEAERKRREAEAEKIQAKRYADFQTDVSKIFINNYLLTFDKPTQRTSYRSYRDGMCWDAGLYEYTLNENNTDFVHLKEIDYSRYGFNEDRDYYSYGYLDSNYFSSGLWHLVIKAEIPTNKGKRTVEIASGWQNEGSYHCLDMDDIRKNYTFDDLSSSEYKNMASIIGEEGTSRSFNVQRAASLISGLNFTLFVGGFSVDSEFEKLSKGFYEKWGKSEFIQIKQGSNIRDRTIYFFNRSGKPAPIKITWNFNPYSYEVEGSIGFEDQDFDWSAW